MTSEKRITLQIVGSGDGRDVGFGDFVNQLSSFRKALGELDRVVTSSKSVYFRVVDLRHNSPAVIVVEATDRRPRRPTAERVVGRFFSSIDSIGRGEVPEGFDPPALDAFLKITARVGKGKGISQLLVSRNGDAPRDMWTVNANAIKILGPDRFEYGSWTGMLDQINIHGRNKAFEVYPTDRLPNLRCHFNAEKQVEAIAAIGKYVTVRGRMKYSTKFGSEYPREMVVEALEVHPGADTLPMLRDLRGTYEARESGLSSEDLIARSRGDW